MLQKTFLARLSGVTVIGLVTVSLLSGCATAPPSPGGKIALHNDVNTTLKIMYAEDPSLRKFVTDAYGYAIFPSVGKGGLIAGGAYGRGEVYEKGQMIGYADLSQATIGAQAGGQEYAELVVFQNRVALLRFQRNDLTFAANASAVALKSGAATTAQFENGAAVFVRPTGGLMVEAVIGGQSFSYQPK